MFHRSLLMIGLSLTGMNLLGAAEPAVERLERSPVLQAFRNHFNGDKVPEFVEMLWAIDREEMGPGKGWFHAGQSYYGWDWLAKKYDNDGDNHIIPLEFTGPTETFVILDRDKNKVLTAKDMALSERTPGRKKENNKELKDPWSQVFDALASSAMKMPSKEELVAGLFKGEIGSIFEGPNVNDPAPDFTLPTEDGSRQLQLSGFRGKKPVVLIFGSFT